MAVNMDNEHEVQALLQAWFMGALVMSGWNGKDYGLGAGGQVITDAAKLADEADVYADALMRSWESKGVKFGT